MTSEKQYTGVVPIRFRAWTYRVLTAGAAVAVYYDVVPQDGVDVWATLAHVVLGTGTGLASLYTRKDKRNGKNTSEFGFGKRD